MRTLILFRHGKSDWDAAYATDHERPLATRGRDAAKTMGRLLARIDEVPELAVSSSAVRARDSLQLAARAGNWASSIRVDAALYEASSEGILHWLHALEDSPGTLLLTGHEPTWSDLAGRLIGHAVVRVPTGAMLRIDLDRDSWRAVEFGTGELRWLIPPKLIGRMQGHR